ncbi:MAG: NAD-dependent epimerase/dehydratase family protein [Planctomycetes bacterium]|nr:NAD-dependent epimerase/dehydratase family protein [Planctomycetota bacterium]
MKVLVTGGAGFVGRHLVRLLERRGHACDITSRDASAAGPRTLRLALPDEGRCLEVLRASRPDAVVHLAGVSYPPDAERSPREALDANVEGTLGLLRALRRFDPEGRVLLVHVSTGQVYDARGPEGKERVFAEDSPLGPATAYGRTKLAADLAVQAEGDGGVRRAVVFRPFNHTGPGQRPDFVVPNFARQVARMERAAGEAVLEVGDLRVSRDFCDVRDIAEAYALAVEGAVPPGVYNLASGRAVPLEDVIRELQALTPRRFSLRAGGARFRAGEPMSVRGDASKVRAACGWEPKVPLPETLAGVLEEWRRRGDA